MRARAGPELAGARRRERGLACSRRSRPAPAAAIAAITAAACSGGTNTTILSVGGSAPARSGTASRRPSASASASLTPPMRPVGVGVRGDVRDAGADEPVHQCALRGVRGDRLHRAEQQRVVGEQHLRAAVDRLSHGGRDRRRRRAARAPPASAGSPHVRPIPVSQLSASDSGYAPANGGEHVADADHAGPRAASRSAASQSARRIGGQWPGDDRRRSAAPVACAWCARATSAGRRSASRCCARPSPRPASPTGSMVSSAGIGDWHVGQGAHPVTERVLRAAGYPTEHLVRQITGARPDGRRPGAGRRPRAPARTAGDDRRSREGRPVAQFRPRRRRRRAARPVLRPRLRLRRRADDDAWPRFPASSTRSGAGWHDSPHRRRAGRFRARCCGSVAG